MSAYALVHAAATASDRERHAAFLVSMLLLAFAALAVAPLFLAFRGAPTPAESLTFALSLSPALAAMLVARTGRLVLGHLVASSGFAGVALALFLGPQTGPGAAIAWLVAAYLEAAASRDGRLVRVGALVGCAALAVVVGLSFEPRFAPAVAPASAAVIASLAMLVSVLAILRMIEPTARAEESATGCHACGALDTLLDAVVMRLDANGSVLSFSRPERSFLAGPNHAILGRSLLDRVLIGDRPAFLRLIDEAAHSERTVSGTVRICADDRQAAGHAPGVPHYLTIEMRARRPIGAREPNTTAGCEIVATLTDITGREQQGRELADARRAVEEALRARDRFLTLMSHELRTPLNAIIGFSEILASRTTRPDDVAKQCEFARVIKQSGQQLLAIVNAVLDVSRIQSGMFSIQPEPFDVADLLDQSFEAVVVKAREASVRMARDYPAALGEIVGDRRALKQALVAVLSNAVKFTPGQGQVTLTASLHGQVLLVVVADTGIGIAGEDLGHLGEPFFQTGAPIDRPFDGSGLGLALVHGLVGLHGGTLAIASAVGLGTHVTIKLPLDCRNVAAASPAPIAVSALRTQPISSPFIKDAA